MNKTLLIVGAIVVLLLLGGGGYYLYNRTPVASPTPTPQNLTTTSNATPQKASLKTLIGMNSNQTCTFQDVSTGSSGTMYIGDGNIKGDFQSQVNGQTQGSHMISDGVNVYVWIDGQTQGFKASQESMEEMAAKAGSQAIDINKEVDYECTPWTIVPGTFNIPTDVSFQDFSSLNACAACANMPAEAQAQCKAALKCD